MDGFADAPPFQARVEPPAGEVVDSAVGPSELAEDDWSLQALEEAYQRALDGADSVADQAEAVVSSTDQETDVSGRPAGEPARSVAESEPRAGALRAEDPRAASAVGVSPERVLEALLFVGGDPLPGRRLADLLGGEHLHPQLEGLIGKLDGRYVDQGRPYHVQLGEGGYRLTLRQDFEPVRNRVFGLGPRDVRLSQDALEILALVAYQQPIGRTAIEGTGKPNVVTILRQLLRLELVALERGDGGQGDVTYRTTSRFLELFSLDRLEDLPHPEDLMFR